MNPPFRQLLNFSRKHELTLTSVSLNEVINEVIGLIEYSAEEKHIQVEKQFQENLTPILGDKHLLEQVALNLGTKRHRGNAKRRRTDIQYGHN